MIAYLSWEVRGEVLQRFNWKKWKEADQRPANGTGTHLLEWMLWMPSSTIYHSVSSPHKKLLFSETALDSMYQYAASK